MLSILIPTYNFNITKLVNTLHTLALETYVDFEILVMEDGSTKYLDENKAVADLEFCNYTVLTGNIGRSAIRNRLADEALYEHLLFLDCDGEIKSPYFVEKYLSFCREDCVVVGGTAYDADNQNPNYSLRLKYGREREAKTARDREKPEHFLHFSTFNFLISKKIFNQIRFDENIDGYGHEDTLFGHQITLLNCEVHHIDNPLFHNGLDDNKSFIKKTEEGTRNLFLLYQTGKYPFLRNQSKLLNTFIKLDAKHLTPVLSALFDIFKGIMYANLTGKKPSLKVYDIYKLSYLAKLSLQK